MHPRFLLFFGLISLATCIRPNLLSRFVSTDGVGRSLLRSSMELNCIDNELILICSLRSIRERLLLY